MLVYNVLRAHLPLKGEWIWTTEGIRLIPHINFCFVHLRSTVFDCYKMKKPLDEAEISLLQDVANKLRIDSIKATEASKSGWEIFSYVLNIIDVIFQFCFTVLLDCLIIRSENVYWETFCTHILMIRLLIKFKENPLMGSSFKSCSSFFSSS